MDCREFETRFEHWYAGTLDATERAVCEEHLAGCSSCSELAELALLPVSSIPPRLETPSVDGDLPVNLLSGVLERTSGDVCTGIEERLAALVVGDDAARQNDLLIEHVEHCQTCSGLVSEIERLAVELPRLANITPQPSLVDSVLRATLPLSVRARRWWARTGPRWVGRPRFAAELSYAMTLILVVVFGTPVSPLQAMPQKALEIVRSERVEGPARFEAWRAVAGRELNTGFQAARVEIVERTETVTETTKQRVGTIVQEVASWFVNAGTEEETPAQDNQQAEETS